MQILAAIHLVLLAGAEPLHDLVFQGNDPGQIDAHFRRSNPPTGGVAGVVGHLGAHDHRLRRCAARVDAGAAQMFFLD
jgi:hypothetical protein